MNTPRKSRREQRRENWRTIRRVLPDALRLARPHARLWAFGLLLLLIGKVAGLVLPGAPKFLMDDVLPSGDSTRLHLLIGAILGATFLQGLTAFLLTQTISKAGQRLIADMRLRLHQHILRLEIRYFDKHKSGEISSRVMNDVESIRNLVGTGMIEFLGGLITSLLAFMVLLFLNWKLTLAIIIFAIVLFVVLIKSFTVLGPAFRKLQEQKADLSGRLTESVGGVRVLKAYRTEEREQGIFANGVMAMLETMMRTINGISILAFSTSVLLGLLGAIILYLGGRQLMAGSITAGEFISYLLYLAFMIAPLASIMMIGTQLSEVFAGIERMNEILAEKPEDQDEPGKLAIPRIDGLIEFQNVSFAYEAETNVLHNVSFSARPGTVTALVGPSGSGKSTLIGLVSGFHAPGSGSILVDGQDLALVRLYDYRRFLGVVLQENFLFAGTIRDNLAYVRPNATEADMRKAAEAAHCLEFIERFPDGFDTVIGERGVRLSGGQRQRLAIARAILADPRILILDEATSALDSESEAYIQEALGRLMEGRTTFVIAHRLSTIRHADQILVLDGGRVVEQGGHEELLAARGRYFEMYSRQHHITDNLFLAPGESDERASGEPPPELKEGSGKDRLARISKYIT